MKKNICLRVEEETMKIAKHVAIERETSVSALFEVLVMDAYEKLAEQTQ